MRTPTPDPTDKVLVWRKPDGGMAVTRIQNTLINNHPEAPEAYAAFLQQDPNHAGLVLEAIVEASEMPDGGMPHLNPEAASWSPAWECDGKCVAVSMPKARDLHRDRMREARAPLLTQLDVAYQRADEAGDADAKKRIAADKQLLRDVTAMPEIETAKTLDQLKAVWPEALG